MSPTTLLSRLFPTHWSIAGLSGAEPAPDRGPADPRCQGTPSPSTLSSAPVFFVRASSSCSSTSTTCAPLSDPAPALSAPPPCSSPLLLLLLLILLLLLLRCCSSSTSSSSSCRGLTLRHPMDNPYCSCKLARVRSRCAGGAPSGRGDGRRPGHVPAGLPADRHPSRVQPGGQGAVSRPKRQIMLVRPGSVAGRRTMSWRFGVEDRPNPGGARTRQPVAKPAVPIALCCRSPGFPPRSGRRDVRGGDAAG